MGVRKGRLGCNGRSSGELNGECPWVLGEEGEELGGSEARLGGAGGGGRPSEGGELGPREAMGLRTSATLP